MDRRTELANTVLIGADMWLFHRDNCVFEQVTGAKCLSDSNLQHWQQLLEYRHHRLRERGAAYGFFVAPEKHVIYADKLPAEISISASRPVLQLQRFLEAAGSPVQLIYPFESLLRRRSEMDTFWKSGSHWNSFGAFLAYRDLHSEIARLIRMGRPLELEDIRLVVCPHAGDIGVRLEPEPVADELLAEIKHPLAQRVFHNRGYSRGAAVVFEHPDQRLPRAVFFRDSALSWMERFLAESFSRLVCVSTTEVYFDLVEAEKPDIVVTEMIERYVNEPGEAPHDLDCRPFEELTGVTVAAVARATAANRESAPQLRPANET